jgi:hypothetical protein
LPASLVDLIPSIGDHDTAVLMHNDGVVQGLSEIPFMQDYERWGVLTIGTGLGNARSPIAGRRKKLMRREENQGEKSILIGAKEICVRRSIHCLTRANFSSC